MFDHFRTLKQENWVYALFFLRGYVSSSASSSACQSSPLPAKVSARPNSDYPSLPATLPCQQGSGCMKNTDRALQLVNGGVQPHFGVEKATCFKWLQNGDLLRITLCEGCKIDSKLRPIRPRCRGRRASTPAPPRWPAAGAEQKKPEPKPKRAAFWGWDFVSMGKPSKFQLFDMKLFPAWGFERILGGNKPNLLR